MMCVCVEKFDDRFCVSGAGFEYNSLFYSQLKVSMKIMQKVTAVFILLTK